MKMQIRNSGTSWIRLTWAIAIAGMLQIGQNLHAAEFKEDFSKIADQTELKSVEGWKLHFGKEGSAKVELAAGFSGTGLRIKQAENYLLAIPEDKALSLTDESTGEFRIKWRSMAPHDSYVIGQVLIGYNDGMHGLAVRFDGGSQDGSADNFIRISSGGENWGKISFTDIKTATWEKGTWYEIIISNIATTLEATGVAGKVTIRQADDPSKVLVDGAPIVSTGGKSPFSSINILIVGISGPARTIDFDDILLTGKN